MELYKKHRPKKLEDVVGQDAAIKVLQSFIQRKAIPRAMAFVGPSGSGKTTLARILANHVECSKHDLIELNCAESRGIDTVREIQSCMKLAPMGGKSKVWILDELHRSTIDSQSALLKMLEDTPRHVYFFIATTDPHKLLEAIRTRCSTINCQSIHQDVLSDLLGKVCKLEKLSISEDVIDKIAEAAEGSARKALVILDQVCKLSSEEEMLDAVSKEDARKKGIDLARVLFNPKSQWSEVARLIKDMQDDPETVRRIVLGYVSSVLLNKQSERAYKILYAFEGNFFDSGKAGLIRACYDVIFDK